MRDTALVTHSAVDAAFAPPEAVARLGMIVLSTDLTSERDAAKALPGHQAALHVTRVVHENPSTPENLRKMGPRLAAAAEMLASVPGLAAILYSCTAASVEIGDASVAQAINSACPDVPVVTPPDAAVRAFAALGVRRVALVTPYLIETTQPMLRYLTARGLEIVNAECLGIADDRTMARVTPETIVAAAEAADCPEAEGVFISCTALAAFDVIDEIETRLGKPVISSNQAGLWQLMQHASVTPARGPGRLFTVGLGERA
ncbi:MAG: ectoine utilization protein EutA [Paracoccaceae bacterium]